MSSTTCRFTSCEHLAVIAENRRKYFVVTVNAMQSVATCYRMSSRRCEYTPSSLAIVVLSVGCDWPTLGSVIQITMYLLHNVN